MLVCGMLQSGVEPVSAADIVELILDLYSRFEDIFWKRFSAQFQVFEQVVDHPVDQLFVLCDSRFRWSATDVFDSVVD